MSFNQLYLGSKFTHPKPSTKTKPEDEVVAFFVGDQTEEPFLINRELVIEASPVFRAAFGGEEWLEREQTMVLDDVEPEIFAMLSHWLHNRGRLPTFRNADNVAKGEALVKYAKLWILADRLIMPFLQNNTIDLFQQKIGEVGLDECEGLMDLLYGDRQNADGEIGMLKKVLLYKFYVTHKEQLDSYIISRHTTRFKYLRNTKAARIYGEPDNVAAKRFFAEWAKENPPAVKKATPPTANSDLSSLARGFATNRH